MSLLTRRILLIEDDPTQVRLVQIMLDEYHQLNLTFPLRFVLTAANRLTHALELIQQQTFDVILADLGLPDSQGLNTLRQVRQAAPHSPVLVLSHQLDEIMAVQAVREGAQGYLLKEYVSEQLFIRAIQYAIERHQIEGALRQSEARYRNLIETAPDVIFTLSLAGEITSLNPAFETLTGWPRDAYLGQPFTQLLHAEDVILAQEMLEQVRHNSIPPTYELRLRTQTGAYLVGEFTTTPQNQAGQLAGILGIGRDITARKQAEAELQRRASEFVALYEITRDLGETRHLSTTLETIVERALLLLDAANAHMYLYDAERHDLEMMVERGIRSTPIGARVRLGTGMAGRVALARQPFNVPDYRVWEGRLPEYNGLSFTAVLQVPMLHRGELIGVLGVSEVDTKERRFSQDDMHLLTLFAGQAASVVHNARLLEDLQRANANLEAAYDATIEGWSRAMDLRDQETEGHSQRVTELTLHLAQALGIDPNLMVHIRRGALLHDMGKMGIPDHILLKRGSLTDDEWRIMRQHPSYAKRMLSPIEFLRPALDIPYCHHERWDGTGYPNGLQGEEIPLAARIFAVVDVWDALRSNRPYRQKWEVDKVRAHIVAGAGTHFDPQVVEAFLHLTDALPASATTLTV
jgi:PAS domain S-box-containing protein